MARIIDLLAAGRTFSFEFFPPRTDEEAGVLEQTINELEPLAPSFVSVTYRGGRSSRELTTRVVLDIQRRGAMTAMPHLTCVAHPRSELEEIVAGFAAAGVENLLALGGDPLPDELEYRELEYAIELVHLARERGFRSIGVAAHPLPHPRSPDRLADRRRQAEKLRVADFGITQMVFEVDDYRRLVDELAELGVEKPVVPGIMPILSLAGIQRMAELSGTPLPAGVLRRVEAAGSDPAAVRAAGIGIACELCDALLAAGAPGLHFYTLNRSRATREIYSSLGLPVT